MLEGIAFASKASSIRSGNHVDMTGGETQHFDQSLMQIVQVLGASVEGELAILTEGRDAGMLFQGKMGAAFVKRKVFANEIGLGEARLHVAELIHLSAVDVTDFSMIVDSRLRVFERALHGGNRGQE